MASFRRFGVRILFAGVGIPVAWSAYTLHHINSSLEDGYVATEAELYLLSRLPLRKMSRLWGKINETQLPSFIQVPLLQLYSSMFSVNLEECDQELCGYQSMQDFFTRCLKDGVRPIHKDALLVSPVDGTVLQCGHLSDAPLNIKGVLLPVHEFLQESPDHPANGTQQAYCVLYLSPGDYHRFHSPTHWQLLGYKHITGQLYSVHPKMMAWLRGLLALNERCILQGRWQHGQFHYAAVGATNVGSMLFTCDPQLRCNQPSDDILPWGTCRSVALGEPVAFQPGQEIGMFRLGSTVVLIFDAPAEMTFCVKEHDKVKMGEALCRVISCD